MALRYLVLRALPYRHTARISEPSVMLHDFINSNRSEILEKCAVLSDFKGDREPSQVESLGQIQVFIDQLVEKLRVEDALIRAVSSRSTEASSPALESTASLENEMAASASTHGGELHEQGFSVDEVIRNYGSVCQAVTTLASETNESITASEFRCMNFCLDDAIANAVLAFFRLELGRVKKNSDLQRRVRNHLSLDVIAEMLSNTESALLAHTALRSGKIGIDGSTGKLLESSLKRLKTLVNQLADNTPAG